MIGKLRLLFWIGIFMIFLPFLGIPNTWKMTITMLIGIGLITTAVALRKRHRTLRGIIRNLEHTVTEATLRMPQGETSHHE